jgi:hypothetical protein
VELNIKAAISEDARLMRLLISRHPNEAEVACHGRHIALLLAQPDNSALSASRFGDPCRRQIPQVVEAS